MNYIQRAQIAQRILTAAGDADVTAVTLYGYQDAVTILTTAPLAGYEYEPVSEGRCPRCEFDQDGITVQLVYVEAVPA